MINHQLAWPLTDEAAIILGSNHASVVGWRQVVLREAPSAAITAMCSPAKGTAAIDSPCWVARANTNPDGDAGATGHAVCGLLLAIDV
jgi:hypothetical protein